MVTLYLGGIRPLPPENQPTGMFKREIAQPVWLGRAGLAGDAQADRRVHGGPEKALHQFPVAHYARLAAAFPAAAALLVPGSIGENLSADGWEETTICIGDVFRLGDARIQVSQPRSPCWKIDRRYGQEGMAKLIDAAGIAGWYFRVVEEGEVATGCRFQRIDQPAPAATLQRLWQLWQAQRPYPDALEAFAATPGLAPNWTAKFVERARWLRSL
ncbi:MAG: MOSC domain-containing protein [Rhodocyclaceae bacterium]|nr:MOSC domain-containing protein [Rhodocyclaceae bacterium]